MSARVWYHHVLTIRKERISYTKKQQRIFRLVNEQEKKKVLNTNLLYTMSASSSVADVDAWITQLQDCKQLSESDIKKLCDKVSALIPD